MKKKKETKIEKKEKNYIKKPFLLGFVASLIILVLFLFYLAFFSFSEVIQKILPFLVFPAFLSYLMTLASFYYIGKKYNLKLIKKISIILAILFILFLFLWVIVAMNTLQRISQDKLALEIIERISSGMQNDLTPEEINIFLYYFAPIFLYLVFSYLVFAIFETILSVKIFGLEKIKYSKAFSILNIILYWSPVTIVGLLLVFPLFVGRFVLQSLMFYNLAKQNGEIKNG